MIYVTHDQTEAMTFADQVVVMHEGNVVQIGHADRAVRAAARTPSSATSSARPA